MRAIDMDSSRGIVFGIRGNLLVLGIREIRGKGSKERELSQGREKKVKARGRRLSREGVHRKRGGQRRRGGAMFIRQGLSENIAMLVGRQGTKHMRECARFRR